MEGMLDNLSQPVAFATAPLGPEEASPSTPGRADAGPSSDTEVDDSMASRITRRLGTLTAAGSRALSGEGTLGRTTPLRATQPLELDLDEKFDEAFADDGENKLLAS